jgi:hypothetical protein
MRRKEAEKLIGGRVFVWTSLNGEYVGVLEEVFASPWRGRVRITGVIKPAVVHDLTRPDDRQRRGFRPGDLIEAGGVSIKPTELEGTSYLEALRGELTAFGEMAARPGGARAGSWLAVAIKNLGAAIAEEERPESK